MAAFGKYMRQTTHGYLHWCPGCDEAHHIAVGGKVGPQWKFNGNPERPDFSPSIRVSDARRDPLTGACVKPLEFFTSCHYFLHNGQLKFCGDSAHKLAGKMVPLPEWPHKNWVD